jgi:hypothetical protein
MADCLAVQEPISGKLARILPAVVGLMPLIEVRMARRLASAASAATVRSISASTRAMVPSSALIWRLRVAVGDPELLPLPASGPQAGRRRNPGARAYQACRR